MPSAGARLCVRLPMSHQASYAALQPLNFDPARVSTPAFVVDLSLLKRNLELLDRVQREAGCKVLLALKGFAMFGTFPLVRQYLARLLRERPARGAAGARRIWEGSARLFARVQGGGDAADHPHRGSCVVQLPRAVAEIPAGAPGRPEGAEPRPARQSGGLHGRGRALRSVLARLPPRRARRGTRGRRSERTGGSAFSRAVRAGLRCAGKGS